MSIPLTVKSQLGPYDGRMLLRCEAPDIALALEWLIDQFGEDFALLERSENRWPDAKGTHFSIVTTKDVAMYLKLAK